MLGLYIHLPFCRVHCAYCPFAISTHIGLQDAYTDALVREIEERVAGLPGHGVAGRETVDTIFFGGGTPSRTSLENLRRVVDALRAGFAIDADAEFSMEANPEDVVTGLLGSSVGAGGPAPVQIATPVTQQPSNPVTQQPSNPATQHPSNPVTPIAAWRSLGINRLSIGVQSFHDAELRPLGRVHGRERALAALGDAVASGIRTSLDLILGLPNQTAASFRETLDIAIDSGVGHLSLYMLDLEEGTALARQVEHGRMTLPDDELVASLYVEAVERLGAAGLAQYEISNFARPGQECRHNLRYWRRETYLGFGLAAHSFAGERRFANTRDIDRYIAGAGEPDLDESLGPAEQRRETIFLRLRQSSGIHYDDIVRLCGQEGIEWMDRGLQDGWLRRDGARVAFTPSGFLLSNDYISQLF